MVVVFEMQSTYHEGGKFNAKTYPSICDRWIDSNTLFSSMNRFAIYLILLTPTLCGCTASEPTDAELVSLYTSNDKVFAELRSMIIVDQQVGRVGDDVIGDSWFKIDNISIDSAAQNAGLSRTRYNEYMPIAR